MPAIKNMTEKDWQAQDDANTLARAAEIQADKTRMAAASKAAKSMVTEVTARAKAIKRIASKSKSKPKRSK